MTQIPVMYVFVEIQFDTSHLIDMIVHTYPRLVDKQKSDNEDMLSNNSEYDADSGVTEPHLAIMGTIQFLSAIHEVGSVLKQKYGYKNVIIPQAKPLSSGETLGCTSPVLLYSQKEFQSKPATVIFIADGRFHLEAVMIRNATPNIKYLRYDPYNKIFTHEKYDIVAMKEMRWCVLI